MKKILFVAASLVAMVACNKAVISPAETGTGYLNFSLSSDDVVVETKAVSAEDLGNYNVTLGGQWTKKYSEILNQTFTLAPAQYTLSAENITETEAETGNGALRIASPVLNVTVVANETTTETLSCVPQSSKLTLQYTDAFKDVFTSYSFELVKKDGTSRKDGKAKLTMAENTPVFYNGDVVLTYTLKGVHELNGLKTLTGDITLTKGHSLTVKADQSSQSGGLKIQITADDTLIEDTDQTITIDPYL